MEKQLRDKLDAIIKAVKNWAKDDYEIGHTLDPDDFNEFQHLLDDDNLNINRLLFDYYIDCVTNSGDYY